MNKSNHKATVPKPGSEYEKIVADIYRQFARNGEVREDVTIIGKRSGHERQIDVAIYTSVAGHSVLLIIECKDYRRKVGIGRVEELLAKMDDVGAAIGVLVSDSGFSQDTIDRAKAEDRVNLASVIDVQNGKIRTSLTFACIYEYILIDPEVIVYPVNHDGTKYRASEFELQKFFNFFVADWNSGKAPCEPGDQRHRCILDNKYTGATIGLHYSYSVKQELYRRRIPLETGSGIYDVANRQFRTAGFRLEQFPVRPDDIRKSWERVASENVGDENIKEHTLHFRAVQTLEPSPLSGKMTVYP